jgi:hypothetical protein
MLEEAVGHSYPDRQVAQAIIEQAVAPMYAEVKRISAGRDEQEKGNRNKKWLN